MYVCSCFGVTEEQIREHAASGACTPRQIASASRAGTDCGSCVRRIQGLLGRGGCPRREAAGASLAGSALSAVPAAPAVPGRTATAA
ncbi:bacterioferritin-associated ferredoxin [Streptomyces sp. KL2]|uniref:(2Fe-2S)-binding protein n=1 Tax=Streptomyces sp. KL2 TaxID=3050126 RepID=UPI00397A18EA